MLGINSKRHVCFTLLFCVASIFSFGQNQDSTANGTKKEVKRYIRPCIFLNNYSTPQSVIRNKKANKTEYSFRQSNIGFYAPLYTNTWYQKDGVSLNTFHFLINSNFSSAVTNTNWLDNSPAFYRLSFGLRTILSSGSKNIWFFDVAPFLAEDNTSIKSGTWRYTGTIIYNRTVSEKFSFRIGITKTYLLGAGQALPFFGFRFGRLDGVYFNLNFPRDFNLNFPMGSKFKGSVFTKTMGGRYNFHNTDTTIFTKADYGATLQFARTELITGFMTTYTPNKNLSFYLGLGFSTRRGVEFSDNKVAEGNDKTLFESRIEESGFLTFGASVSFGAAKKVANNYALYDVLDLNNKLTPGDDGFGSTNSDIPTNPNKVKIDNLQYKDIEDLITDTDLN